VEKAIVLVTITPGSEHDTLAKLKGMRGVKEVYQLYGLYDILVIVEGEDDQAVKSTITEDLRSNQSIVSTITMKVV
jgi:DNA-binding Lrp family transcriptional regulator